MSKNNPTFGDLAKEAALLPQEQLLKVHESNNSLFIGIPKEITYQENRVPLTPASVKYLTDNGHTIYLESGAGKSSNFPDIQYSEAGAQIISKKEEVYSADIILKIAPPTKEEIEFLKPSQLLISALQINNLDEVLIKRLLTKRVNAISYEFLEDESGALPAIRAMSELAGSASIMIAAEYLNNSNIGKGELIGGFTGIPPTQIVIIGAGSVGEYAARAGLGIGANVKVFDNHIYRLRRIQENVGSSIYTSTLHPNVLANALLSADVVIGALRGKNSRSPIVVTEEMVMNMKPKSVIIDVSIDHGGNFETSEGTNHAKPVFKKHEVIHYCVPNITSRVSRTASYALSNIFTPILVDMAKHHDFEDFLRDRKGARKGVYAYKGMLTNSFLAERFHIPVKDLNLILGSYI
jgi:alanine dehydrogenase